MVLDTQRLLNRFLVSSILTYAVNKFIYAFCKRYLKKHHEFTDEDFKAFEKREKSLNEILEEKQGNKSKGRELPGEIPNVVGGEVSDFNRPAFTKVILEFIVHDILRIKRPLNGESLGHLDLIVYAFTQTIGAYEYVSTIVGGLVPMVCGLLPSVAVAVVEATPFSYIDMNPRRTKKLLDLIVYNYDNERIDLMLPNQQKSFLEMFLDYLKRHSQASGGLCDEDTLSAAAWMSKITDPAMREERISMMLAKLGTFSFSNLSNYAQFIAYLISILLTLYGIGSITAYLALLQ